LTGCYGALVRENANLSRSYDGKLRRPLSSNIPLTQAFIVPDCTLPRRLMQNCIGAAIQRAIGADVVNSKQAERRQ